jgi:acetyltransferase
VERHPGGQDQILNLQDLTESFSPIHGQSVTLRPLRGDDQDIEHAFVSGLSPDTRHNRLLGGAVRITPEYIERLTRVDFSRDMAIAATTMLEGRETLIGVSRYVLVAPSTCEFAIVIADAWQGRGIGKRLLGKLVDVARSRGLSRIYGDILATNRGMLEMVKRVGFALERHPEDATLVRAARVP